MPPRWGFDYPDFKTVNLDGQHEAFILWSCRTYGALISVVLSFMNMPPRWGFDFPDFKTVNLDGQHDAFILWSCRTYGAQLVAVVL
jgi:hypothetical protein